MKRTPDTQRAGEVLPAFLADETDATATATTPVAASDADAEATAADTATDVDAATVDDGTLPTTTPPTGADTDEAPAVEASVPAPQGPVRPKAGGRFAMFAGGGVLVAGLALSLLPELATKAAIYGVQPNLPFVVGTLLFAAGALQRHIGRLQHRVDEAENRRQLDADAMHQNLQQLVAGNADKAPTQGDELQHLMLSLQRQDEKINNLTKAIKMYGKPLMEISGQGTELAGGFANMKALIEGGVESNRQGLNRIESQLRTPPNQKEFTELNGATQKLMARIEALAAQKAGVDLAPLQQQIGRLEVTVAAIAQRLDDNEVRKSLLRLEEAGQKDRDVLQELLRGDTVQKATAQLQARVDSATKGLNDGLAQLREGNLNGLETAVRDIQREVSGVATTLAQISAAVKGGVRTTAMAPAPTPTGPVAAATPQATAPTAAPTTPTTNGESGGGYSTGARSSGGKNVLGAIAKLKQMKG